MSCSSRRFRLIRGRGMRKQRCARQSSTAAASGTLRVRLCTRLPPAAPFTSEWDTTQRRGSPPMQKGSPPLKLRRTEHETSNNGGRHFGCPPVRRHLRFSFLDRTFDGVTRLRAQPREEQPLRRRVYIEILDIGCKYCRLDA